MEIISVIDMEILKWIQENLISNILDKMMLFFTHLGDMGAIWIVASVILLINKKHRKIGVTMLLSLAICLIVGNITLKPLIARVRPCYILPGVRLLIPIPHDFSFPSGHTMSAFATSMAVFLYNKKIGTLGFILGSIIAFSRLYLFVHYPTDILGGMVLGLAAGYVAYNVMKIITERSKN